METTNVYRCGVNNDMVDLDPFAPLDEVMKRLSNSFHYATTICFLVQLAMHPNMVELHKIVNMFRNGMILGDAWNAK